MVVIRLSRQGTKKKAHYLIVATNAKAPRDGKYLEKLGFYDPAPTTAKVPSFKVNREAVAAWVAKGAQVSETVGHLLNSQSN